jgi:phage tail-like protein
MPTPSIRSDARIGITARFAVVVDGIDLGGWSKIDGLKVTFKHYDYKPLGHNGFSPVLPDRLDYSDLTLTRAINDRDSPKVQQWLAERAGGTADGTGGIALLGTDFLPVMIWNLRGVYPAEWSAQAFDANGKTIALEVLKIAHEGFLDA